MRHSINIVAALCSLAAVLTSGRSLADSGSLSQNTLPEVGTCETGDVSEIRVPEETKPDVTREFQITAEMKERADLDADGEHTINDLVLLLGAWGNCPVWSELSCWGDINSDNMVDYNDLSIMLSLLDMALVPVIEVEVKDPVIVIQVGQQSKGG